MLSSVLPGSPIVSSSPSQIIILSNYPLMNFHFCFGFFLLEKNWLGKATKTITNKKTLFSKVTSCQSANFRVWITLSNYPLKNFHSCFDFFLLEKKLIGQGNKNNNKQESLVFQSDQLPICKFSSLNFSLLFWFFFCFFPEKTDRDKNNNKSCTTSVRQW